jgi:hypothetical protein
VGGGDEIHAYLRPRIPATLPNDSIMRQLLF